MRRKIHIASWLVLVVPALATAAFASDAVIKGSVNDSTGKPIRGAIVKVTMAGKSVTRYSQQNGQFEITVPSGTYDLGAEAFGYAAKRMSVDTSKGADVNFSLSSRLNITQLTGADIDRLIPDDTQGKLLKASCTSCHDFAVVMRRRGQTADEWKSFLPRMTNGRRTNPVFSPVRLDALGPALEKYFGPDSPYLGPDADPPKAEQVEHPALADAALRGTMREYSIPVGGVDSFAHSIFLDQTSQTAWFSEIGLRANNIGRFDIESEKFTEYPLPPPFAEPHSGVVGKDGRVWMTLAHRGDTKIVSLDPATGKIEGHDFPNEPGVSHTISIDRLGNLWISGGGIWSYDVKNNQFKNHPFPVPDVAPPGSAAAMESVPGDPARTGGTYHVTADSKGGIWASSISLGIIISLNPETGATKEYQAPDTPGIRGIVADKQDNIWFSDWYHHRLGKFDPKTGAFQMYRPPTIGASPYGIVVDSNGYVWYADMSGNNITRFDPKTENFVEYPIPTHPSYPRFIDVARDGKVWFSEYWAGKIGVLDPGDEGTKRAAIQ